MTIEENSIDEYAKSSWKCRVVRIFNAIQNVVKFKFYLVTRRGGTLDIITKNYIELFQIIKKLN
jgi:hypothetical protein